jgi:hypothetical protein
VSYPEPGVGALSVRQKIARRFAVNDITITESDIVHVALGIIVAGVLLIVFLIVVARRDARSRNSNREKE